MKFLLCLTLLVALSMEAFPLPSKLHGPSSPNYQSSLTQPPASTTPASVENSIEPCPPENIEIRRELVIQRPSSARGASDADPPILNFVLERSQSENGRQRVSVVFLTPIMEATMNNN